ncbi:hypothetical protein BV898_16966 [Hypsibius exemplaris]|uniref:Uncharacterized protein n=1 Tax=Hypsibius exemplaris TaxID=2072580 RepID=A0A9X6NFU9_HYPEX|nr:hypothetical protein BV898_16966 [Hypsibius exemplaris]
MLSRSKPFLSYGNDDAAMRRDVWNGQRTEHLIDCPRQIESVLWGETGCFAEADNKRPTIEDLTSCLKDCQERCEREDDAPFLPLTIADHVFETIQLIRRRVKKDVLKWTRSQTLVALQMGINNSAMALVQTTYPDRWPRLKTWFTELQCEIPLPYWKSLSELERQKLDEALSKHKRCATKKFLTLLHSSVDQLPADQLNTGIRAVVIQVVLNFVYFELAQRTIDPASPRILADCPQFLQLPDLARDLRLAFTKFNDCRTAVQDNDTSDRGMQIVVDTTMEMLKNFTATVQACACCDAKHVDFAQFRDEQAADESPLTNVEPIFKRVAKQTGAWSSLNYFIREFLRLHVIDKNLLDGHLSFSFELEAITRAVMDFPWEGSQRPGFRMWPSGHLINPTGGHALEALRHLMKRCDPTNKLGVLATFMIFATRCFERLTPSREDTLLNVQFAHGSLLLLLFTACSENNQQLMTKLSAITLTLFRFIEIEGFTEDCRSSMTVSLITLTYQGFTASVVDCFKLLLDLFNRMEFDADFFQELVLLMRNLAAELPQWLDQNVLTEMCRLTTRTLAQNTGRRSALHAAELLLFFVLSNRGRNRAFLQMVLTSTVSLLDRGIEDEAVKTQLVLAVLAGFHCDFAATAQALVSSKLTNRTMTFIQSLKKDLASIRHSEHLRDDSVVAALGFIALLRDSYTDKRTMDFKDVPAVFSGLLDFLEDLHKKYHTDEVQASSRDSGVRQLLVNIMKTVRRPMDLPDLPLEFEAFINVLGGEDEGRWTHLIGHGGDAQKMQQRVRKIRQNMRDWRRGEPLHSEPD